VEQVLDRDRQSVQAAAHAPGFALEVGGPGEAQRAVAVHLDERVQLRVLRVDVREARLDDRDRRRLARVESARELGERLERQVGKHGIYVWVHRVGLGCRT